MPRPFKPLVPGPILPIEVGASGGSPGVIVESAGAPIANPPHTTLNFTGSVTAADAGAGVATINVTGGGGGGAVIFTNDALHSTRTTTQSPSDGTKVGTVNFGSNTASSTGTTADYAAVLAGLNNNSSGTYATTTGSGNTASGIASTASGVNGNAKFFGQNTLGGGAFPVAPNALGCAQASEFILMGLSNTGNISLSFQGDGATFPTLSSGGEVSKTYFVTVEAVATQTGIGDANVSKAFFVLGVARINSSGVLSIVKYFDFANLWGGAPLGDAATASWAIDLFTGGSSPFFLSVIFGAGGTAGVRCVAKVKLVEVSHN